MATKKPITVGKQIDDLWTLREKKRLLEADIKKLEESIKEHETRLFESFDAQGLKSGKGTLASISISESVEFNLENDEEFFKYVKKNNAFHLLQRRISSPAAREIFEQKGMVPGLAPFPKRRLNIRSIS
jgi:hypothetical protein